MLGHEQADRLGRIDDEAARRVVAHRPTDDAAAGGVEHHRKTEEAAPDRGVEPDHRLDPGGGPGPPKTMRHKRSLEPIQRKWNGSGNPGRQESDESWIESRGRHNGRDYALTGTRAGFLTASCTARTT